MPRKISLQPGYFYHIFNRGNNRENIFLEQENYAYFLRLYHKYITPLAHTYAYALLPNHFHFLISIRNEEQLPEKYWCADKNRLSQPFSNFFNAYAKAINLRYQRVSSLFEDRFERVEVKSDADFTRLVGYLHLNPQKHGYIRDFRAYPHSSYQALISHKTTSLERAFIWEWFGSREHFIRYHTILYRDWLVRHDTNDLLDD